MSSPSRNVGVGALILLSLFSMAFGESDKIRVCADPNNLPFSNMQQQGFENRIATLLAADLHEHLTYVWQRMGRGFVREYLNRGECDLLIGVPKNYRPVLTTNPYYRSTYVFVTRRERKPQLASLDSADLRGMKIGVQVLEENYTPPGEALARRGLQSQIVGFDTTGENADSIVRAVADRNVDTAIVWGPLAGYFAKQYRSVRLTSVEPQADSPSLPFTFAISMGVRKANVALCQQLDEFLVRRKSEIQKVLQDYGVPQLPLANSAADSRVN